MRSKSSASIEPRRDRSPDGARRLSSSNDIIVQYVLNLKYRNFRSDSACFGKGAWQLIVS